jgi:hypothetical protein
MKKPKSKKTILIRTAKTTAAKVEQEIAAEDLSGKWIRMPRTIFKAV